MQELQMQLKKYIEVLEWHLQWYLKVNFVKQSNVPK